MAAVSRGEADVGYIAVEIRFIMADVHACRADAQSAAAACGIVIGLCLSQELEQGDKFLAIKGAGGIIPVHEASAGVLKQHLLRKLRRGVEKSAILRQSGVEAQDRVHIPRYTVLGNGHGRGNGIGVNAGDYPVEMTVLQHAVKRAGDEVLAGKLRVCVKIGEQIHKQGTLERDAAKGALIIGA